MRESKETEKTLPAKQEKLSKLVVEKEVEDEKLREIKARLNAENTRFFKEKKDLEK